MQRSQENMYVSGMCLKFWAVLDLARLGKGEYEAMVKELVNIAKGVRNCLDLIHTFFFIRTQFIRMSSLNFGRVQDNAKLKITQK